MDDSRSRTPEPRDHVPRFSSPPTVVKPVVHKTSHVLASNNDTTGHPEPVACMDAPHLVSFLLCSSIPFLFPKMAILHHIFYCNWIAQCTGHHMQCWTHTLIHTPSLAIPCRRKWSTSLRLHNAPSARSSHHIHSKHSATSHQPIQRITQLFFQSSDRALRHSPFIALSAISLQPNVSKFCHTACYFWHSHCWSHNSQYHCQQKLLLSARLLSVFLHVLLMELIHTYHRRWSFQFLWKLWKCHTIFRFHPGCRGSQHRDRGGCTCVDVLKLMVVTFNCQDQSACVCVPV